MKIWQSLGLNRFFPEEDMIIKLVLATFNDNLFACNHLVIILSSVLNILEMCGNDLPVAKMLAMCKKNIGQFI
jgi:hypothetical protein